MPSVRLTKRVIHTLKPREAEFTIWDKDISGFGVRVRPNGVKSYVFVYRAGRSRRAPTRKLTIGRADKLTPEQAREAAKKAVGAVSLGLDPAMERAEARKAITINELADAFLSEHVGPKLKATTYSSYHAVLKNYIRPSFGFLPAADISRARVSQLHGQLSAVPSGANRVIAVLRSMYSFAQKRGYLPEGTNPTFRIEKYRENVRDRFLTMEELARLGETLRFAETEGLPWDIDPCDELSKHLARPENRRVLFSREAVAALRLLLLTGCRLREILHLKWEFIDFDRGIIFLPDSKTGRKPVILNGSALQVLETLPRTGEFVVPGETGDRPRHDLKRVWSAVLRHADLQGLRIHDLRHTFASYGAGGGLSLPIIGKLLGHSQPATTQRYAHLDVDPVRRATNQIGDQISAALERRAPALKARHSDGQAEEFHQPLVGN